MATVTGFTADRMKQIEDETVVDGDVVGDNLILKTRAGTDINAGNVRGPQGIQGVPGNINVSPAGGALSGNYPDPGLADGAVTGGKVAVSLKDGDPAIATMRSLGDGPQQAAAGDHDHGDTGWVAINPPAAGAPPFGTRAVNYLEYRKFGPVVEVRFSKAMSGATDLSSNVGGNFPNVNVLPAETIPEGLRPTRTIEGSGRLIDAPQGLVLTVGGSVVWTGGFARNYPQGSVMTGHFVYMAG